jgi:endonuclease/exonuclease/phosphatase family metal-dependent hydrolase
MLSTIRIMTYNLLEGLLDKNGAVDETRRKSAIAAVNEIDPDVLVLNEALRCVPDADGKINDYAAWFNMPHALAKTYDGTWGNVILSKLPLRETKTFAIYNRSGIVAEIMVHSHDDECQNHDNLVVGTYHPHPSRWPAHKAADFTELVSDINAPCLICGDFNAINPEDDPDIERLAVAFKAFTPKGAERSSAERFVAGGKAVFEALAEIGFTDAVPKESRTPTIPTALIAKPTENETSSAMRIDHVVGNSKVTIIAGGVLKTEDTDTASDHYPVWVDAVIKTDK